MVGAKVWAAAETERSRIAVAPERAHTDTALIAAELRRCDDRAEIGAGENRVRDRFTVDDVQPIPYELFENTSPVVHLRESIDTFRPHFE